MNCKLDFTDCLCLNYVGALYSRVRKDEGGLMPASFGTPFFPFHDE